MKTLSCPEPRVLPSQHSCERSCSSYNRLLHASTVTANNTSHSLEGPSGRRAWGRS